MKPTPHRREQVVLITSAAEPASTERISRERRYAISMTIRTLCFLGAVAADGWLRWVLVVGAVVLPYVSVVVASPGVRRGKATGDEFVPMERDALGPGGRRDAL